jgi:hypothetical protein
MGHKLMASHHSHDPAHNIRIRLIIPRKNKPTNQQEKTAKRSNNRVNTLPHNSGNENGYHNNQPVKREETCARQKTATQFTGIPNLGTGMRAELAIKLARALRQRHWRFDAA